MVDNNLLAVALFRRLIELRVSVQRELQHAFVTAAEHRQRAVRRHGGDRFRVIEVVAEFRAFLVFAANDGGHQMGVFPQIGAHFRQQARIFSNALHQNIARAIEGSFAVRDAFISVDIFGSFGFRS